MRRREKYLRRKLWINIYLDTKKKNKGNSLEKSFVSLCFSFFVEIYIALTSKSDIINMLRLFFKKLYSIIIE